MCDMVLGYLYNSAIFGGGRYACFAVLSMYYAEHAEHSNQHLHYLFIDWLINTCIID